MENIFTLSIIKPNLLYHKGFTFFIYSCELLFLVIQAGKKKNNKWWKINCYGNLNNEKNRGCDIVPKDELDMDNSNKIYLWIKISFMIYFVIENRNETLHHNIESKGRF